MNKTIVLLLIIITFACTQPSSKRIEIDLYECIMGFLSSEEKEKMALIIQDYEQHLVNNGILPAATPEGYFDFYKDLARKDSYNFKNDFDFSQKIDFISRENNVEIIECHQDIVSSERYLASKVYALQEGRKAFEANKTLTLRLSAKNMINILSVEDFELMYYRLNTLMLIEDLKYR